MSTKQAITACLCLLFSVIITLTMGGIAQEENIKFTDKYLNKISSTVTTEITGWHTGKGAVVVSDSDVQVISRSYVLPPFAWPLMKPRPDPAIYKPVVSMNKMDRAEQEFKAAIERMNNLSNRSN